MRQTVVDDDDSCRRRSTVKEWRRERGEKAEKKKVKRPRTENRNKKQTKYRPEYPKSASMTSLIYMNPPINPTLES